MLNEKCPLETTLPEHSDLCEAAIQMEIIRVMCMVSGDSVKILLGYNTYLGLALTLQNFTSSISPAPEAISRPVIIPKKKYNLLPRRLRLERVAAMMPKMPPAAWPMAPMRDALFIIRHLWVVNPPGERLDPFINSAIFAFCAFRAQYFLRFDVEVESCFR